MDIIIGIHLFVLGVMVGSSVALVNVYKTDNKINSRINNKYTND